MPNKDREKQLAYQRAWYKENRERSKETCYKSLAKHLKTASDLVMNDYDYLTYAYVEERDLED